jgi:O-antigen ligase
MEIDVDAKALTRVDQRLWRLLIWVFGLATPILYALKPRDFGIADVIEKTGSPSQLAIKGFYIFFLLLAMVTFTHRSGKDVKKGGARAFFLLTIFMAAMPTLSSLISGGTFQWTIIGIIGIYSATYFLPAPPLEWWTREVRIMLLIVFVYGSLVAAVLYPNWAWDRWYDSQSTVAVFSWRLYGTANHSNSLAPLAVFSWILGRFPGCRLKREFLHGAAVLIVLYLAQSKTIWAIALVLLGVYILVRIASLRGFRKYLTFFAAGTSVYAFALYLINYSSLADRIRDMQYDKGVLSLTGRLMIWQYALEMWSKNPWIGKGLDAWFSKAAVEDSIRFLGWAVPHAHNQLLQVLSTTGLIGLGATLLWILYYIRIVRRAPASLRAPLWWLSAFFFLPGFTEVVLQYNLGPGNTLMTWIIFTLVVIVGESYPALSEQKAQE